MLPYGCIVKSYVLELGDISNSAMYNIIDNPEDRDWKHRCFPHSIRVQHVHDIS
jgi:hypothetical protein